MKRILMNFFSLFFILNISFANPTIPDELFVSEHWISLTKSYNIKTKKQKLGTLYRRFLSLLLTYDFYDPQDVKTATAKARFFSFGVHLDIYDQDDVLIGEVKEKIFNFFPTFEIVDKDSSTKLAHAIMNFWGTKFYIYDPETNQEMAIMSRPFFRLKNDWTISVTNRELLENKNIDPRVLMTVLAVQGEIEEWQRDAHQTNQMQAIAPVLMPQQASINFENSLNTDTPDDKTLEALAEELSKGFKTEYSSFAEQSNEEQIHHFLDYCMELVHSADQPDPKKKAIIELLNLRLKGHR